jgi:malonyl-CoA O-methyltransferase
MRDLTQDRGADLSRVRQSFRRGVQSYHDGAVVQTRIATALADLLAANADQPHLGRVFEFGCGTGHLTQALRTRFELGTLILNDLVPEMQAQVQGILRPDDQFLPGPIEEVHPEGPLDAILSASTVQWVPEIAFVLERLCAQLAAGGWLALSGFGRAQFLELEALGSNAAAPAYADAADWPNLLPHGMELVHLHQERIVLTFETPRDVLRHLRATGVNGRAERGWTRAQLCQFEAEYTARFAVPGGVSLTYDPVWVLARKR